MSEDPVQRPNLPDIVVVFGTFILFVTINMILRNGLEKGTVLDEAVWTFRMFIDFSRFLQTIALAVILYAALKETSSWIRSRRSSGPGKSWKESSHGTGDF
jgi:hypothetical protein